MTWGSCRNVCARETFNLLYEYFSEPVLSYLSSDVESVLPLLPESVFTQVSVFFHLCWTSSWISWTCRTQVTKWRTTNRSSRERDILIYLHSGQTCSSLRLRGETVTWSVYLWWNCDERLQRLQQIAPSTNRCAFVLQNADKLSGLFLCFF